jgi:hypothetical protein
MKFEIKFFVVAIFLIGAIMVLPCFLPNVQAFRGGGGGGRVGGDEREDEFSEGARNSEFAEGPRGGEVAEGPRGGVAAEGFRGGEAAVGPEGHAIAKGPQGNVYAGRVGDRVHVLPETAEMLAWGDRTYTLTAAFITCRVRMTIRPTAWYPRLSKYKTIERSVTRP